MQIINNLSIRNKLILIISLFLGLILMLEFFNLKSFSEQLETSKAVQSKEIVASAKSIALHYQQLTLQGKLTKAQAQQQAIQVISAIRYDKTNYVFISDNNAFMVSHPIKPQLNGKDLSRTKDANGVKLFKEFARVAKTSGEGQVNYLWQNPSTGFAGRKISYVSAMEPWEWVIGTGVYVDDLDDINQQQLKNALLTLGLVIPIILLITGFISKRISYSIAEISTTVKRMANGNFSSKATTTGKDEIGQLAQCVNQTMDALSNLIQDVEGSCSAIKLSSYDGATITAQTLAGVKKQRDETHGLMSAMQEMSITAQDVLDIADKTIVCSQDADLAAEQGYEIVTSTITEINSASDEMVQLIDTISELAQGTDEVENVLNIISAISDQTNLLALNAAIEAARAGEQGRGFAVVADEVRNLAMRTKDSTSQIRELNERLKTSFDKATTLVHRARELTKKSADSALDTGNKTKQVVAKVQEILQMNQQVALSVKKQSLVAQDMNVNISSISEIADETSQGASENAKSSELLTAVVVQLEQSLQRFKV